MPDNVDPSLPVEPAADPAPENPTPPAADPAPAPVDPKPADPAPELADDTPDWRKQFAGEDEKLGKLAARCTSPKAVLEALQAAQSKIRSGGVRTPPPADATPEALAAWRVENGIPDTPAGYKLDMPDGLVLGEADKPMAEAFIARMHAHNAPPDVVNEAVAWYLTQQDEVIASREAADAKAQEAATELLREEYGREYKNHVAAATQLIPEGIRDALMNSRLDTGERLGNNAQVIRWLAGVARELNPAATIVPGSGLNASQAIETEISNLKAMMGDRKSAYWKGPDATKLQERYRELTSVQTKLRGN